MVFHVYSILIIQIKVMNSFSLDRLVCILSDFKYQMLLFRVARTKGNQQSEATSILSSSSSSSVVNLKLKKNYCSPYTIMLFHAQFSFEWHNFERVQINLLVVRFGASLAYRVSQILRTSPPKTWLVKFQVFLRFFFLLQN